MDILNDDQKVKKSLVYSIIDGVFYSIKVGIGSSSFAAYAVFLKAQDWELGLLGTLPQVLGSLVQLFSQHLMIAMHSRQIAVCLGAFWQALMYIPIILIFFASSHNTLYLLMFTSLYWVAGMLIGPIWNSWMGDLVPSSMRGSYFGRRNKLMEIASFSSMLLGGFILKQFSHSAETEYWGFVTIFCIAFFARLLSCFFLWKKYEPPYVAPPMPEKHFWKFLSHLNSTDYGSFVLFMCLMNIAIYCSAPYFAPYMLKVLSIDYFTYGLINATAVLVKCLFLPYWGKLCDQFGTKKVLVATGFLMPLVPMFWFFQGTLWYFLAIQAYAGFIWAGFEIAAFNINFDLTDREHRLEYISYYNVLNGIAIFIGGMLGGLAIRFGMAYPILFVMSGLLRYIVCSFFLRKIQEGRTVEPVSYPQLFLKLFTSMPTMGLLYQRIFFPKNGAMKSTNQPRPTNTDPDQFKKVS